VVVDPALQAWAKVTRTFSPHPTNRLKDGAYLARVQRTGIPIFLLLLLLSFFSIRTITRNFELKDIWTAIHADENWMPLSFRGYFTIGAQYVEMKFPDKAGEYYEKAFSTGSWDGNLLGNIIGYHILKGDHAAAINFYEEMLKKNEFITSTGTLNMAVLYMLNGNCERAVQLATSFSPLSNQVKRIELVKKCDTYGFDKFDNNEIQDIYHKQKLGKPVPDIVERSIAVLEDYQYKVLVEGKYYKLEW